MSQKDYINKKKITQILSEKNKLGSILESQQLTDYKSLILSNTILSETEEFDPLNTSLQQNTIYNAVSVPTCPSFIFCKNTLDRINRQSTQRELSVCRHNNYTNSMRLQWRPISIISYFSWDNIVNNVNNRITLNHRHLINTNISRIEKSLRDKYIYNILNIKNRNKNKYNDIKYPKKPLSNRKHKIVRHRYGNRGLAVF